MFDLDQAIAEWRRQMLAGGIKTPVPLDELESHLREGIELRMKTGLSEAEAFGSAAQQIGQASVLKGEFRKIERTSSRRIGLIAVVIGTAIMLRILARYRDLGYVWGSEQLEWFLLGVGIVLFGLSSAMFDFGLGDTRDIRRWKLVGITYSIFSVWISMLIICRWLTEPKLSEAFSLTERLLVFAAVAVSLLSLLGWRYGLRFLPVVRNRRIRTAIGVAGCFLGVAGMLFIWLFIFPLLGHMRAQLFTVLITWAWTAMAILGGVGYGLEEAARRRTTTAAA